MTASAITVAHAAPVIPHGGMNRTLSATLVTSPMAVVPTRRRSRLIAIAAEWRIHVQKTKIDPPASTWSGGTAAS